MIAQTPWREVATPHQDVLRGDFQEAEFAVDLSKVQEGKAPPEYQDPVQFFHRTYLTEGMRLLLESVLRRLSGKGGDPVVQLQTAFGGGKTHSLLSVLHLCAAKTAASDLSGVEDLLCRVGMNELPHAKVAVIDGNRFSPAHTYARGDLKVHTLWGEIAWQLGGKDAYLKLEAADKKGVSPGKEILAELLSSAAPCVILIDELVAFVRQLDDGKKSLPGGTTAAMASFLQALTEACTAVPRTMVLASLPSSSNELGGEMGAKALEMCEKYFGRVHAIWKPVTEEESYSVVRRRLFESINAERAEKICRAWHDWYLEHKEEFPSEVRREEYRHRLADCYPLHPELLKVLYTRWSVLPKFQRTRGVLQLMALSIHRLWGENCRDAMILPSHIPLHDAAVRNRLLSYLPESRWDPVIDTDIVGDKAKAVQVDNSQPLFGAHQCGLRSARALLLATAPGTGGRVGLDEAEQLLCTVQAGENLPGFKDVRMKLADRLHYIVRDKDDRMAFTIQTNMQRAVEDLKRRFEGASAREGLLRKLLKEHLSTLDIPTHIFVPAQDIADDGQLRLAALDEGITWNEQQQTAVRSACLNYITKKGEGPRRFQNRILLLLADPNDLPLLQNRTATYLAWEHMVGESHMFDLTAGQLADAKTRQNKALEEVRSFVPTVWRHLVEPSSDQNTPSEIRLKESRVETASNETLGVALKRHAEHQEIVNTSWAPALLARDLQKYYFSKDDTLPVRKLWEDTCAYLYFPRILGAAAFLESLGRLVATGEWVAYADSASDGHLTGLCLGRSCRVDLNGILVRKDRALRQLEEDAAKQSKPYPVEKTTASDQGRIMDVAASSPASINKSSRSSTPPSIFRHKTRFVLDAALGDQASANRKFREIMNEIGDHLGDSDNVEITLTITARKKSGYDPGKIRIIETNAAALKVNGEFWEE